LEPLVDLSSFIETDIGRNERHSKPLQERILFLNYILIQGLMEFYYRRGDNNPRKRGIPI